jgi:hypothetical protein
MRGALEFLLHACVIFPLPLLMIAWSGRDRKPIEYSILTLSAALLVLCALRSAKLTFLGNDLSNHLYTTMGVNLLGEAILGVHLGMKHRWIAADAAIIIALGWLLVGAINSVV